MAQVLCPRVVGRDREVAALAEALESVTAGRGAGLVVVGDAGIGKSRLVRELAVRAADLGLRVLSGRAVPASVGSPYRPLTEALVELIRDTHLPNDEGMAQWLPSLRALLPGLLPGGDEGIAGVVPAAIRGEAVLQLVTHVEPGGVVIILEDLHWADPDTVALVDYVMDHLGDREVLFAVTLRGAPRSAALDLVRRQRARAGVTQLLLDRLEDAAVDEMLAWCGSSASPEQIEWVRRTAEGVPLLIEDLLASGGLPASITESVRERVAELSEDARAVIEAAAIMGRHFDWELLGPTVGQSAAQVADALAEAVERLLVIGDGDVLRFRHALTREAILAMMLPPHQRSVARQVLAAVEVSHPTLDGEWRDVAAEVARRAGDRQRAGALLVESARASLRIGALATAIDTARRAVDVLKGAEARSAAELLLVEALSLAGRVDDAAAAGNTVIAHLGDSANAHGLRLEVHLALAATAISATRWAMARHQLSSAERLFHGVDEGVAARLAVLAAEVALAEDDPERARRTAERALELSGDEPAVRCHALQIVGRSRRLRDLAGAQAAFEAALVTAEEAGLTVWSVRALHELGTIDMFDHMGVERLKEARHRAEGMGALATVATLDLQLSACHTARWDLERCDHHARSALEIAERLGLVQVRAKALAFLTGTASMRADADRTSRYMALTRAAAPNDLMLDGFGLACRGMAIVMAGDPAASLGVYSRGMAVLSRLPNAEPSANRALWPLVLASLGDPRAAAAVDEARRLGVAGIVLNRGLIAYAEAVLAGRAGNRRRAQELADAGAGGFVNCEVWAVLARFLAAPAARADRWGDPRRWLTDAVDVFAFHGLVALTEQARRQLRSGEPNPWAAEGVTDREADVLRLIAQGRTTKEIAAQLGVSPRTVEKHVESLLRKTGTHTRVELVLHARPSTT